MYGVCRSECRERCTLSPTVYLPCVDRSGCVRYCVLCVTPCFSERNEETSSRALHVVEIPVKESLDCGQAPKTQRPKCKEDKAQTMHMFTATRKRGRELEMFSFRHEDHTFDSISRQPYECLTVLPIYIQ